MRFLSLLAVLALLCPLVACGGGSEPSDAPATDGAAATASESSEPALFEADFEGGDISEFADTEEEEAETGDAAEGEGAPEETGEPAAEGGGQG